MKIGLAQVDYTPPVGLDLVGNYRGNDYASRGVHDPLYAKAFVAENSSKRMVALLSVDICELCAESVTMMREFIASQCEIAPENILIHATHAHSGPGSGLNDPMAEEYLKKAAGAVILASKNLTNSKLAAGCSREDRLSYNRGLRCRDGTLRMNWENPDPEIVIGPRGPVDSQVITLSVEQQGRKKSALVNFANHPAILAGDNWLYSSDYPGYLAEAMSRIYDKDFITLFFNGCCGDLNHIDYTDRTQGRGYQMSQRHGYMLAVAAMEAIRQEAVLSGDQIAASSQMVPLERIRITENQVEWSKKVMEQARREGSVPGQADGIPDEMYARDWIRMYETQQEIDQAEVMVLRIGEIALVGLPGEMFCEIGMDLKKRSEAKHTIVIGLANDSKGYFPTKESFNDGPEGFTLGIHGYETTPGTTIYAAGSGERLAESALGQLSDLFRP